MTVEALRSWLNRLPSVDRDMPYLEVEGKMLTPRQMLSEAIAGTETGKLAQRIWESGAVGTSDSLLAERVKQRLSRFPLDTPLFIVLGRTGRLTPRQVLESPDYMREFEKTESQYMRYLAKLKER